MINVGASEGRVAVDKLPEAPGGYAYTHIVL